MNMTRKDMCKARRSAADSLRMLWLIITAAWVLRNVVALAEGRPMELEPMLLALVLMKLYKKEE